MGRTEMTDADAVAQQRAFAQRLVCVHEVLDACIGRRLAGEALADEQVIAEHPELMPELAHELRGLGMIERARRSASSRSRNGRSSSAAVIGSAGAASRGPALIPGYENLEPIHSGGQGVVYKAFQRSTQRIVAIKLMRDAAPEGLRELSRFEREVQILATLRHPNIVAIHDSGLTPDGRAYFVMDYIEGKALDEYIKEQGTGNAERGEGGRQSEIPSGRGGAQSKVDAVLRLFAKVCDAVHEAHLKGIIHRDLKPSNIRVDTNGEPHVLDFGLAKSIGQPADLDMTVTGQFIGSLPWASPEQAEGAIEKIDVRTDVYALGVVLFQGLTGQFPYDISGPMRDVLERIIHAEPRRPGAVVQSSVLRRKRAEEQSGALHDGIEAELDDELDTIVLKCLSKERERRYQSAGELARDVRRHLADEPIEARRDSAFYVLRKSLGRYRFALAAGISFALVVSALAAYAAFQARQNRDLAQQERAARQDAERATAQALESQQEADRQFQQASAARQAESEQRRISDLEAEHAQSVTRFLVDMLGLADPDVTQTGELTLRDALTQATAKLGPALGAKPAAEATVRTVLGRAYAALGDPDTARLHLERALELQKQLPGNDPAPHYEILWPLSHVLSDLSDPLASSRAYECERVGRQVIAKGCPDLAAGLAELTKLMRYSYPAEQADALHAEVVRLANESLAADDARWLPVADQFYFFGTQLDWRRNPDHACDYLRTALEIYRRRLPETNTRIVRGMGALLNAEIDAGSDAEAETLARQSLAALSRTLADDHWYVSLWRGRLGRSLIGQGQLAEAERLLMESQKRLIGSRGHAGRGVSEVTRGLIRLYEESGRPDEAATRRTELAVSLARSPDDLNWTASMSFAPSARMVFGPEPSRLSDLIERVRNGLREKAPDLDDTIAEIIAARRAEYPDDHPAAAVVAELTNSWIGNHSNLHRSRASFLELSAEAARIARASPDLQPRKKASIIARYGIELRNRGRLAEAIENLRESVAILERGYGTYAFTNWAQTQLAESLMLGKRFDEAEPIALAGYAGLRDYVGPGGGDARHAMTIVLRIYERWGRAERYAEVATRDLRDLSGLDKVRSSDLSQASWRIVKLPDFSPEVYTLALAAAQRAVETTPDSAAHLRTLGAALYRLGRFTDAVDALARADARHAETSEGRQPLALALLAMAQHAAGHDTPAREALVAARETLSETRNQNSANREWVRRAEKTLETPRHP